MEGDVDDMKAAIRECFACSLLLLLFVYASVGGTSFAAGPNEKDASKNPSLCVFSQGSLLLFQDPPGKRRDSKDDTPNVCFSLPDSNFSLFFFRSGRHCSFKNNDRINESLPITGPRAPPLL